MPRPRRPFQSVALVRHRAVPLVAWISRRRRLPRRTFRISEHENSGKGVVSWFGSSSWLAYCWQWPSPAGCGGRLRALTRCRLRQGGELPMRRSPRPSSRRPSVLRSRSRLHGRAAWARQNSMIASVVSKCVATGGFPTVVGPGQLCPPLITVAQQNASLPR